MNNLDKNCCRFSSFWFFLIGSNVDLFNALLVIEKFEIYKHASSRDTMRRHKASGRPRQPLNFVIVVTFFQHQCKFRRFLHEYTIPTVTTVDTLSRTYQDNLELTIHSKRTIFFLLIQHGAPQTWHGPR